MATPTSSKNLILKQNSGAYWSIRLLDNPFVQEWLGLVEKCLQIDSHPQVFNFNMTKSLCETRPSRGEIADRINSAVEELNRDFNFNCPLRANEGMGRDLTNALHRAFTTSIRTDNRWQMNSEPHIQISEDKRSRFLFLAEEINFGVHDFETYLLDNESVAEMLKFAPYDDHSYMILEFDNKADTNTTREDMFGEIKEEHKRYYSGDHTAYLKIDILGKDYLQAFIDQDDPREWDVTPSLIYTSGLELDPHNTRCRFKKSPAFLNWLRSYGIEPDAAVCGYMPIGDIDKKGSWIYAREAVEVIIE